MINLGTLQMPLSAATKTFAIGSLFAAVLIKTNNADYMGFSDDAHLKNLNPDDSTLTIRKTINANRINGGTNLHSIFHEAVKAYDRIIFLSDMQGWVGYDTPAAAFSEYKTRTDSNPFIYSFDLQGYGSLQFPEQNIFCIAGFSDKIFDAMRLLESDKSALINKIEQVEL